MCYTPTYGPLAYLKAYYEEWLAQLVEDPLVLEEHFSVFLATLGSIYTGTCITEHGCGADPCESVGGGCAESKVESVLDGMIDAGKFIGETVSSPEQCCYGCLVNRASLSDRFCREYRTRTCCGPSVAQQTFDGLVQSYPLTQQVSQFRRLELSHRAYMCGWYNRQDADRPLNLFAVSCDAAEFLALLCYNSDGALGGGVLVCEYMLPVDTEIRTPTAFDVGLNNTWSPYHARVGNHEQRLNDGELAGIPQDVAHEVVTTARMVSELRELGEYL